MKTNPVIPVLIGSFFLLASCGPSPRPSDSIEETPELTEAEAASALERGKQIAQLTFAELSGHLSQAIEEGGVPNALQYCNVAAYPLVDSLSQLHQATIRRTSLRIRNLKNAPTEAERAVLLAYQEQIAAGGEPAPRVERLPEGNIAFYAPIRILPLCLQCHGKVGQDVLEENTALLRQLYPQDEAVGYALGDLRGIWSITFPSE